MKFITRKLVYDNTTIFYPIGKPYCNRTIIYVLGGGQDSLHTRLRKASILYHQGLSDKILILSRTGTTEYDPDLGRNLTNNEWSIRELERYKVPRKDIEVVPIKSGLLGTFNEAKNLPRIIQEKGYNRLVLVTSSYHTMRFLKHFHVLQPIETLNSFSMVPKTTRD